MSKRSKDQTTRPPAGAGPKPDNQNEEPKVPPPDSNRWHIVQETLKKPRKKRD